MRRYETESEPRRKTGFAESREECVTGNCHGHESTQLDELVGALEDQSGGVLVITAAGERGGRNAVYIGLGNKTEYHFHEKLCRSSRCNYGSGSN